MAKKSDKSETLKSGEVPKASTLASRLRTAVRSQGVYTKELDPAIDVAGGAYRSFLLARRDVDKLESTFYHKTTTMGNDDIQEHPAIKTMERCSEMLRKSLKEIGLTLSTLAQIEDDPMEAMLSKLEKED